MKNKETIHTHLRQLGLLTSVPFVMLFGPLIGFFGGRWIDDKLDFFPFGTAIFIILGFVASAREVIRIIKSVASDSKRER